MASWRLAYRFWVRSFEPLTAVQPITMFDRLTDRYGYPFAQVVNDRLTRTVLWTPLRAKLARPTRV